MIFIIFNSIAVLLHMPYNLDLDRPSLQAMNTVIILVAIIVYIVECLMVLLTALNWANEYYEITPSKVRHKYGYTHRTENVYDVSHIQEITVVQDMWGRMFHYGTITITSPILSEKLILKYIDDPVNTMHIMHDIITKGGKIELTETEKRKTLYKK
jgi:membrane protein YdbS with pleckstrin-like domain